MTASLLAASTMPSPQSVTPAVKTWIASALCISVLTFLSIYLSIFCLPICITDLFSSIDCSVLQGSSPIFSHSFHLAVFPATLSPRGSYPSWLCCTILASLHALGWRLVTSLRNLLTPLHLFLRGLTNTDRSCGLVLKRTG